MSDFDPLLAFERAVTAPVTSALPSAFAAGPSKKFTAVRALAAGCRTEFPPIKWKPVANECEFIRTALATGGKGYSNPLWHATIRAASFMENGNALAHAMSNEHASYTEEETQREFERVVLDNSQKGLGWPQCETIHRDGCEACAQCPHFGKGKSPLNFGLPTFIKATAPGANAVSGPVGQALGFKPFALPDEYEFDADCRIVKVFTESDKDGNMSTWKQRLFRNVISFPWAQKNPSKLVFITSVSLGETRAVALETGDMATTARMLDALFNQDVLVGEGMDKYVRDFTVALLEKLWNAQQAISTVPFGWYEENGIKKGFAHGGTLYRSDGTKQQAGVADPQLQLVYAPTGSDKPWHDALKIITDQNRAELETIVAAAFGSPLMPFTGQSGCMVAAYSSASGIGKSTALTVGQAVWGHAKKAKEVSLSTPKSLLRKAGMLGNIPIFWDELKDTEALEYMDKVLRVLSEGIEQNRLNSSVELQTRGTWNLLFVCCLNASFIDFVVQKNKTTPAGMYRVFEFKVLPPPGWPDHITGPGRVNGLDVDRSMAELERHYAHMGSKYAEWLANNIAYVDKLVQATTNDFRAAVGCQQSERFWAATCGSIIAGATIANTLGAPLNVPAIRAFLTLSFYANRQRVKDEHTEGGTPTNTEHQLSQFFKDHTDEQIWVSATHTGAGRPPAVVVYREPAKDRGTQVNIRWSVGDRRLVISKQKLVDWLTEKDITVTHVLNGLKDHFNADVKELTVGAGTNFRAMREASLVIPVPVGSPFENLLLQYGPPVKPSSSDTDVGAKP